jgi:hypothetical protein
VYSNAAAIAAKQKAMYKNDDAKILFISINNCKFIYHIQNHMKTLLFNLLLSFFIHLLATENEMDLPLLHVTNLLSSRKTASYRLIFDESDHEVFQSITEFQKKH